MASIVKLSKGKQPIRAIDFVGVDGIRKRVRLGTATHDQADTAKRRIEHLVNCQKLGDEPDARTTEWLCGLSDKIHERVARHGLCKPRIKPQQAAPAMLGQFIEEYIASRANLKPNTLRNYNVTRGHLLGHFGRDRLLTDISPGDADDFQEVLRGRLGAATVSREIKRTKQFFRAAVRRRLIAENPFTDLATPAQANPSREFFVTREMTDKILKACPDAQWRLIIALSRYGGLRCPSEHLALTWDDVDWARERITVHSPKTEHHEGGESRVIPIFPELKPYLEAASKESPSGIKYLITRYRDRNANLRTQFLRIIKRAGLEPWPKLFHNLRASRQTELTSRFPLHVVCEWIGNSAPIASKHYLQVTEDHFADALVAIEVFEQSSAERSAESAAPVQQKAQQHCGAPIRTEQHCEETGCPQPLERHGLMRSSATRNENGRSIAGRPLQPLKYPHGESNPGFRTENPTS